MRRVIAVVVLAALGLFLPVAAAEARVPPPGNIGTPINCHKKTGIDFGEDFTYTVKICTTFHYRLQNDGDGVYLEGMNIWVAQGCNELESDHPVNQLHMFMSKVGGGSPSGQSISSMNDCSAFRDLEMRGPDKGPVDASLVMNVRVDTARDHAATHTCIIRPKDSDTCSTWHN